MTGTLIVNAFWRNASMEHIAARLRQAAASRGVALNVRTNAEALYALPSLSALSPLPESDFVLFWDKDVRLAAAMEKAGARVLNSARAIALCDDKTLTHLTLAGLDIPTPETVLCPHSFPAVGYPQVDFLRAAGERLGFPMVVKEGCGSFGEQVYLARNEAEAAAIVRRAAGRPMLLQRFIRESAGRDMRLYMVGGRCVAAMRRVNAHDFRANIQHGGHAEPCVPEQEEIALVARACRALGLDFAGVDILRGAEGPLLCEVNSNAHFTALEALTRVDVAGAILSHAVEAAKKP